VYKCISGLKINQYSTGLFISSSEKNPIAQKYENELLNFFIRFKYIIFVAIFLLHQVLVPVK
jgi:hypothetical protein